MNDSGNTGTTGYYVPPPDMNCSEAVELFVTRGIPNPRDAAHLVDWDAACLELGTSRANVSFWIAFLNQKIFALSPPFTAEDIAIRKALSVYTVFVLCMIGMLANLVVLVVLALDKKKTGTVYLLLALAVTDELVLLGRVIVPGRLISGVVQPPAYSLTVFIVIIWKISEVLEVYLIVCMTVERYLVVCFPLKARVLCTVRNTRYAIMAVAIFSVVYCIPVCVALGFPKGFPTMNLFTIIYEVACKGLIVFFLPLLALFILNFRLMWVIFEAKRRRKEMTHAQSQPEGRAKDSGKSSLAMTTNIIAIVSLFLVCHTMTFIWFLWAADKDHIKKIFSIQDKNMFISIILPVCEVFMCVNSTVNVFIYFLFYPKFRQRFVELFCPCITRNVSSSSGGTGALQTASHGSKSSGSSGSKVSKSTKTSLLSTN